MSVKVGLTSLFYLLRLFVQSSGLLIQTKIKHMKAKTTFKKTLILHGIPSETAQELAKAYPDPLTDILNLIKNGSGKKGSKKHIVYVSIYAGLP